jgi:MFS family permease
MSGVLGTYAYTSYFNIEGGYRQGGITSAMPAGSLVGALSSSFVADRFSRKTAIQLAALIWIAGSMCVTNVSSQALY